MTITNIAVKDRQRLIPANSALDRDAARFAWTQSQGFLTQQYGAALNSVMRLDEAELDDSLPDVVPPSSDVEVVDVISKETEQTHVDGLDSPEEVSETSRVIYLANETTQNISSIPDSQTRRASAVIADSDDEADDEILQSDNRHLIRREASPMDSACHITSPWGLAPNLENNVVQDAIPSTEETPNSRGALPNADNETSVPSSESNEHSSEQFNPVLSAIQVPSSPPPLRPSQISTCMPTQASCRPRDSSTQADNAKLSSSSLAAALGPTDIWPGAEDWQLLQSSPMPLPPPSSSLATAPATARKQHHRTLNRRSQPQTHTTNNPSTQEESQPPATIDLLSEFSSIPLPPPMSRLHSQAEPQPEADSQKSRLAGTEGFRTAPTSPACGAMPGLIESSQFAALPDSLLQSQRPPQFERNEEDTGSIARALDKRSASPLESARRRKGRKKLRVAGVDGGRGGAMSELEANSLELVDFSLPPPPPMSSLQETDEPW